MYPWKAETWNERQEGWMGSLRTDGLATHTVANYGICEIDTQFPETRVGDHAIRTAAIIRLCLLLSLTRGLLT